MEFQKAQLNGPPLQFYKLCTFGATDIALTLAVPDLLRLLLDPLQHTVFHLFSNLLDVLDQTSHLRVPLKEFHSSCISYLDRPAKSVVRYVSWVF